MSDKDLYPWQEGDPLMQVDWNKLSELGLLERFNREILHPLGIAAFFNPETGQSGGALISNDGEFEYAPNMPTKITPNDEVRAKIKAHVDSKVGVTQCDSGNEPDLNIEAPALTYSNGGM